MSVGIVTVGCDASHAREALFFKAMKKGCPNPPFGYQKACPMNRNSPFVAVS
jgi:hypothetical protein